MPDEKTEEDNRSVDELFGELIPLIKEEKWQRDRILQLMDQLAARLLRSPPPPEKS